LGFEDVDAQQFAEWGVGASLHYRGRGEVLLHYLHYLHEIQSGGFSHSRLVAFGRAFLWAAVLVISSMAWSQQVEILSGMACICEAHSRIKLV
jgi:hypothetical protein